MAYRLSLDARLSESVRKCAREQLAGAAERLERADADPADAVHEARKHLKKTRSLLRLVRPALGSKAYRRENAALRDIGLGLSGARDADVRVQTAIALGKRGAGRLPAETFSRLQSALALEAAAGRGGGGATDLGDAAGALRAAEERVAAWPLDHADWETVIAGAMRAYARGQDALALAREDPTPERLHEWRKRAKDLWYHERLLTPVWPGVLAAHAEEAHTLTELLGDDHDLAVLAARLDGPEPLPPVVDASRAELRALAEDRSTELRDEAMRLGRRVYAESPKAFARRLARYVHVAVAERRPAGG